MKRRRRTRPEFAEGDEFASWHTIKGSFFTDKGRLGRFGRVAAIRKGGWIWRKLSGNDFSEDCSILC